MPYALYQLCLISRLHSQLTQAAGFSFRALELAAENEQTLLVSKSPMHLTAAAPDGGLWKDGALLFGAMEAIREEIGAVRISPWEVAIGIDNVITSAKEALGTAAFNDAVKVGAALSLEEATQAGHDVANTLGTLGAEM